MGAECAGTAGVGGSAILVVEDHQPQWELIRRACRREEGWRFQFFPSSEDALDSVGSSLHTLDAALVDIVLPGMDGIGLLSCLARAEPRLPVLMVTGENLVGSAVRCMKAGAFDYITKPFGSEDLLDRLRVAVRTRRQARQLVFHASEEYLATMMGPSERVASVARTIDRVGPTALSVLLEGESGTGKELLARRIHAVSVRPSGPFVAVDCGAIPESLIESELFGFKKGSFTGATSDRKGKFELAHGGTLFLDEIGNLPYPMQGKLLRALQEREVTPIGSDLPVRFDIRVVSATNSSLKGMVDRGEFRLDLYHRLAEFPIAIPPLRERVEDLLHLSARFLLEACQELHKKVEGFSQRAIEEILADPWTGNVRELRSVIRRATLVADRRIEELRPGSQENGSHTSRIRSVPGDGVFVIQAEAVFSRESVEAGNLPYKPLLSRLVRQIERGILASVLEHVGGNKRRMARTLGLDYKTVLTKVRDLGLE
ncbi:MAG: sigma-54-dependent Fis family transcriptional regulator [Planctomycetes bacterium]|nr:sigma-54-dependent Fis family transcriptional regulator [Planctomycetota bacterium]